ncbi:DUF2502 domain-containing protein [Rahnella bonaserana]|uniref:DUF2502 domain-containing protein n=1 Tax=Rahnella bonaserana TaxID=2816248 RepID=UPI0024C2D6A4|nr:DUF2502 domain-containing protein [Rahnella bonaserana]WHZ41785.1 DUF2502 domain-containing protein [Rahnella bonaserana]
MLKPVLFATLFFALLPAAVPAVQASSFSLNTPGLSINIGDRDNRGYYWDGYDWRNPGWWNSYRGHHYGYRGPRGHYWDGYRWRDQGWWDQRHQPRRPMPPPHRYHGDHGRPHYDHGRGPDRGHGHDRGRGHDDHHGGHGDHRH